MGWVSRRCLPRYVCAAGFIVLTWSCASWGSLQALSPITLPTGGAALPAPQQVAVNTATNVIYVSDSANNTIYAVDAASGSVTPIDVGAPSSAIAVNSDTDKIYVGVGGGNPDIVVVDGQTNSVLTNVGIGVEPDSLAVDEADNQIFAAYAGDESFDVIDGSSDTWMNGVNLGPLSGVAYDSTARQIYVTGYGAGAEAITAIDPATLNYTSYNQDTACTGVAVNTATDELWVTRPAANEVGVYTSADLTYPDVVSATAPSGVAVDSMSNMIYVSLSSSNALMAIDGPSRISPETVPAGADPQGVAVNPITGRIYVANQGDGTVSVFSEGSSPEVAPSSPINLAVSPITTASPENVAVDAATGMAYVTDTSNNTVYSVDIASGSVSAIDVGAPSNAIAVNSITGKVYVGVGGSSPGIDVIDTVSGNTVSPVPGVSAEPEDLAVDEAANSVYAVFTDLSLDYMVINGQWDTVGSITSGYGALNGVALNHARGTVYATSEQGQSIAAIDMLTFGGGVDILNLGCNRVAVNTTTGDVWIVYTGANLVGQHSADDLFTTTDYDIGAVPWDVAVNPFLNGAYATDPTNNLLYMIDGAAKTLLGSVAVGSQPHGVAVDVNTGQVLVANHGDGTLSILNLAPPARASDTTPPAISSVSVNPYVVDVGGDTITVYVSATDNVGVTSVTAAGVQLDAYNSGTLWIGSIPTDPAKGTHTFDVVAADASGNVTHSSGQYNTATVLNVRNSDIYSQLLQSEVFNYQIRLWGRVTSILDANNFYIDDGYGHPVQVTVSGHGLSVGQFVVVRGQLYGGTSAPRLDSTMSKMTVVQ